MSEVPLEVVLVGVRELQKNREVVHRACIREQERLE